MHPKDSMDPSNLIRLKDESLSAWKKRTSPVKVWVNFPLNVLELGFPFIQMRIHRWFARTFTDEMNSMCDLLINNGIEVQILVTDIEGSEGSDYLQFSWLLFDNEAEAIQARLMLDIHPDHFPK
jgi:hypothetical protein